MPTVNETLADLLTRHQVYLTRYSTTIVRRMVALLNRTDADIVAQIQSLDVDGGREAKRARLEQILDAIHNLSASAYEQVHRALRGELEDLAEHERTYNVRVLQETIPVRLDYVTPSPEQVRAAATRRPFQGRLLSEWMSGLSDAAAARIRDALRIGVVEGQTIDQMVRRVRGTRANQYADGILEISRRDAEGVVRTAVNHVATAARQDTMEANADILKGVQWVSTLDGRTTAICRARDGKLYPVDSGPRPPAHFRCRSTIAPVTKSWRDLGIDLDEAPPGTRASMDGQVPADQTYGEWLAKQPRAFVVDVLGETKAKLFLDGKLPMDRFVDLRTGDEFTLEELRKRDAAAFARAGLAA